MNGPQFQLLEDIQSIMMRVLKGQKIISRNFSRHVLQCMSGGEYCYGD